MIFVALHSHKFDDTECHKSSILTLLLYVFSTDFIAHVYIIEFWRIVIKIANSGIFGKNDISIHFIFLTVAYMDLTLNFFQCNSDNYKNSMFSFILSTRKHSKECDVKFGRGTKSRTKTFIHLGWYVTKFEA